MQPALSNQDSFKLLPGPWSAGTSWWWHCQAVLSRSWWRPERLFCREFFNSRRPKSHNATV